MVPKCVTIQMKAIQQIHLRVVSVVLIVCLSIFYLHLASFLLGVNTTFKYVPVHEFHLAVDLFLGTKKIDFRCMHFKQEASSLWPTASWYENGSHACLEVSGLALCTFSKLSCGDRGLSVLPRPSNIEKRCT